ncbi:MAG: hypothetical protein EG824_14700 [Deltaproteobacteria bacterium]|nr:hypothetical protein [Deltaproteobacteria bacterium]
MPLSVSMWSPSTQPGESRMSKMPSDPHPAFLCDRNLGRLAKWLRIMGFDTEVMKVWDDRVIEDAILSGRTFLTRKRSLAGRTGCIVMENDHVRAQVSLLFKVLSLGERLRPFTRCSICNQQLKYAKPDDVKTRVPEYVYATRDEFGECPVCARVYWRGTHATRFMDSLDPETGGSRDS